MQRGRGQDPHRIDRCVRMSRPRVIDGSTAKPASAHVAPVHLLRRQWRAIITLLRFLLLLRLLGKHCCLLGCLALLLQSLLPADGVVAQLLDGGRHACTDALES